MTAVTPELVEAYKRTRYRVDGSPPFHLRVDVPSAPLAALMTRFGAASAALITAWNPYSAPCTAEENARVQGRLQAELEALGLGIVPGFGEWEDAPSEGEPSFLVIGIDAARACDLGRRYRQHAILLAEGDAVPRLVLLSPVA